MLRWRIGIGIPLIAILVALCWLDNGAAKPGIYFAPLAILLYILATQEMIGLFRAGGHTPLSWAIYTGTALPVIASCAPIAMQPYPADCPVGKLGWLACGLAAGLVVAVVGEMSRYETPGTTITNLSLAALSILYVGGLIGFIIQLRLLPSGMMALLSMIFAVKVSDTGQYACGKLFGKHKLAPRLSPGKTWQGTIGGIAISMLLTTLVFRSSLGSPLSLVVYALCLTVAGIVGDLAESLLKRDAGVKDSSRWLPGFGGVLDILDSLLIAAPVAYACWVTGLVGP